MAPFIHGLLGRAAQLMGGDSDRVRVINNGRTFGVQMDVRDYAPEEITVNVADKAEGAPAYLTITGRHEERQDDHGFVSRSFSRRYVIPNDVDETKLTSDLNERGRFCKEFEKI